MTQLAPLVEFPSTTLKSYLVGKLRDAIISGNFKPGDRLNESKLAREFNVSRIPVREALMQLQEQGLVMNHPRRGMFVNKLSDEETQKINSVRVVLEAEAIKLCRKRLTLVMHKHLQDIVATMEAWEGGPELDAAAIDLSFHRAVWEYSGNDYLHKTLDTVVPVLFTHQALENISNEQVRWRLNHHRQLLEVIEGSSNQTAEEAILNHLRIAYNSPERFSSLWMDGSAANPGF